MLSGQVLLNELEQARQRVSLLEQLYALETGDAAPQTMTIVSPPSPSILKQIAHAPAPRVQVTPRTERKKREPRALPAPQAEPNNAAKEEARRAAYWRVCVRCKGKFGRLRFWPGGNVCKGCDPEGATKMPEAR